MHMPFKNVFYNLFVQMPRLSFVALFVVAKAWKKTPYTKKRSLSIEE